MRLKTLILENFRAYHARVRIPISSFTALIGRNDVGKSTILEALDIFLEGGTIKIDRQDACVRGDSSRVIIGCVFDELPDDLVLDSTAETRLSDEYLLNADGDLEIIKIFDCTKSKPTVQVFTQSFHPTETKRANLLQLKQAELKKLCGELSVNLSNLDKRVNAELRKAIWASSTPGELQLQSVLMQIDKDESKQIWDRVSPHLPLFALFQSDRRSNDADSEVQDPMKLAMKQAIANVQVEIDAIKRQVEKELEDVANRTLAKLSEMDPELARSLRPYLTADPKWDGFSLSLRGDDDIPINKRGSGVRRLILLNFFRAEVERRKVEKGGRAVIYAFEEPETSQHPNNQAMLVDSLVKLARTPGCQVIITTHTPEIAGRLERNDLLFIEVSSGNVNVESGKDNPAVLQKIADTLGILPSPVEVKVALFVEGPHDVRFWLEISRILHQHTSSLADLGSDSRIVVVPVGGGTLKQWVQHQYLLRLKVLEVHVYDRDLASAYQPHCDAVNIRNNGSWATLTTKRSIENYLHPDAIEDAIGVAVSFLDTDDVPGIVSAAVMSDTTGRAKYKGNTRAMKRYLNDDAARAMTYVRLQQSDPSGDIIGWLTRLSQML